MLKSLVPSSSAIVSISSTSVARTRAQRRLGRLVCAHLGHLGWWIRMAKECSPAKRSILLQPMIGVRPGYVEPMFLYMFYGFYDASWQCCAYLVCFSSLLKVERESYTRTNISIRYMGALSNSGRKAANFVGFYRRPPIGWRSCHVGLRL